MFWPGIMKLDERSISFANVNHANNNFEKKLKTQVFNVYQKLSITGVEILNREPLKRN